MGGTAVIEPARFPADVEVVRALFRDYAAELDFDRCFQGFDRELAGLPGDYAEPGGVVLLARADGEPVGCVALRPLGEGRCEMKRLYLRPAARGGGLGRRLAEAIVADGRGRGYRAMRLETIPAMQAAIVLYRALGFREIPPYRSNPIPGALCFELEP
jgi:ribosomal protein S18 acetylase RimI-like enzyme